MYDDESFARRAGEIIARAVRAAAHGLGVTLNASETLGTEDHRRAVTEARAEADSTLRCDENPARVRPGAGPREPQ
jgi:hypothetical protein